jgi:pimeloyl-ACP methyl ester carboxylesterase
MTLGHDVRSAASKWRWPDWLAHRARTTPITFAASAHRALRGLVPTGLAAIVCIAGSPAVSSAKEPQIHYRHVEVDGLSIFYREAGSPTAPTILLLHGFPTSSHMFRDLIPLLADRFHLVAPDYPGFGYSSTPSVTEFTYTFDHLADVVEHFMDALHLQRYALYMQDYGGPIGFRLATRHSERVSALLIQNANAYDEGITPELRRVVLRLRTDRSEAAAATLRLLFELPATQEAYLHGEDDPSLVSPDAWRHAQWGMDRPGDKDIQFALQANYWSNLLLYDQWHEYFRRHHPRTLVTWGKGDPVFAVEGATAYRKDLPNAEVHLLSAGHFALETKAGVIAAYIRSFLDRH